MPDSAPLIRLASVSKRFSVPGGRSDVAAVDRVSLDIEAGQRFGIIGSSGAGKSTLLRLINLLEAPDAGSVLIDGRDLTRLSRRDLREARAGIGMIFQQFNLLQNATVYDNVAFPLTLGQHRARHPLSRADRRVRVDQCLKIVGLAGKADSHPAQLSGGQKQRVAIARALAGGPAVMLCDEPTSALDSETTRSVLEILGDVNAGLGVTLVIVTHELPVARTLCERVAVMADGRIVEDIAMEATGDRLETAIARANRGGADIRPTAASTTQPRRRVGGLPLPGQAASRDTDALVAADVVRWECSFPTADDERVAAAARETTASPLRRAGGLPMPGRFAPPGNVARSTERSELVHG